VYSNSGAVSFCEVANVDRAPAAVNFFRAASTDTVGVPPRTVTCVALAHTPGVRQNHTYNM